MPLLTTTKRSATNAAVSTYDNSGQLLTAVGKESGGSPSRLQEQFGYNYDPAGNLSFRTNNALVQTFSVNAANELSTETNGGTLTVAGTTTSAATNVAVNGSAANLYGDATFALGGCAFTNGNNTFTAIAKDSYARKSTNSITCYLPATNNYTYDANGNLLSDGTRNFSYDDENQLIAVWVTNVWQSVFIYDGKMRRRIRKEYAWLSGAWVETNEVHYIYDGNLVLEERDINNLPQITYTRGNDLSLSLQGAGGIGGLLSRTIYSALLNPALASSAHTFYHAEGNGNITCLITGDQAIAAKYEYNPFGVILSQSGPLADANLYRFSSKECHPNSGLINYLFRFCDTGLQRWMNRDPLGEPGFEVLRRGRVELLGDGPNLYAYVKNDPANHADTLGLDGEATLAADPSLLMDEEEAAALARKQCKCAAYAAAVQAAKKAAGAVGGCKSGDSCAVLAAKNTAWLALAIARSRLNKVCFGGGDYWHQKQQADAWANVGKCGGFLAAKGCLSW